MDYDDMIVSEHEDEEAQLQREEAERQQLMQAIRRKHTEAAKMVELPTPIIQ